MAFNNNKVQVTLQINGEDVVSKLKAMQKEIAAAGLEFKKLTAEGKDTTEVTKKIEELGKEYRTISSEVAKTAAAAKKLGSGVSDGQEVASNSLKELRRELRTLSRDFEGADLGSERQKQLGAEIRRVKILINEQTDSLKLLKDEAADKQEDNALAAMTTQLKELRHEFDQLATGADGADALAKQIADLELKLAESTRAAKEFKDAARFNALTSVTKDLKAELENVKEEMKGMDKASEEFKLASAKAKN
jgi:hypothetical protein